MPEPFFSRGYLVPGRPWTSGPWFALEVSSTQEDGAPLPLHLGGDLVAGVEWLLCGDSFAPGDYPVVVCYPGQPGPAEDWGFLYVRGPGRWLLCDRGGEFRAVPGFVFL
jgi:hypothetical protein